MHLPISHFRKGRCSQREEENLERLDHRNVVTYLGSYMDGDNKCLVMELCDTSLEKYVEEKRKVNKEFQDDEISAIIRQILEAVAYMHDQHGMLHRYVTK